ncbi:MAG: LCP family protein [Patescibacteria group bacterium]
MLKYFNTGVIRNINFPKIKRKILKQVWLLRISIAGIFLALVYLILLLFGYLLDSVGVGKYLSYVNSFIFTPRTKIESTSGRTNILILGKAGSGQVAPDLTDTIIFVSLSLWEPKLVMVSIPRDIWIPEIRAKLNSAYYWGNQKQAGGGLTLAKSTVEEIMGTPVQYGLVIDFSGFKKIIDMLGGIEVMVENSFVDKKFPIPGKENDLCEGDPQFKCRWETIKFDQGKALMDGETALKFVRSRNSEGDEGTDLAREARQQKVLTAIKERALSGQTIFSPQKIISLLGIIKEILETDIDGNAASILTRRFLASRNNIKSFVIPENLLVRPPISPRYDNQYVFIPKDDSWQEVQKGLENILY